MVCLTCCNRFSPLDNNSCDKARHLLRHMRTSQQLNTPAHHSGTCIGSPMPSTKAFALVEQEAGLHHGHKPTLQALLAHGPPSVSFGTFGSQPPPPSRPIFATPPRNHAPLGIPRPSASPSTNNWSLPKEAPFSPSVTQPWAAPPRVGSPASRDISGPVKARAGGRRMHSRWDQNAPKDIGSIHDWSANIKTPTWFPHLAPAQQPAAWTLPCHSPFPTPHPASAPPPLAPTLNPHLTVERTVCDSCAM
jgi:hypothetical protein